MEINTSTHVNTTTAFEVPQPVISKASVPKTTGEPFRVGWFNLNPDEEVHVYLYFSEIQALTPTDTRKFDILWNDNVVYYGYSPLEFTVDTLLITDPIKCKNFCVFDLVKTKWSSLPPSFNAMEAFGVLQLLQSETDENDGISTIVCFHITFRTLAFPYVKLLNT